MAHLAVEEHGRQVVVAAHELGDRAPHLGILVPHAAHVRDARQVGRVEGGERGREARAVRVVEGEPRIRHLPY
eukprot:650024-Prymnesium_polylepis.1